MAAAAAAAAADRILKPYCDSALSPPLSCVSRFGVLGSRADLAGIWLSRLLFALAVFFEGFLLMEGSNLLGSLCVVCFRVRRGGWVG
jgi:hypothetical protein